MTTRSRETTFAFAHAFHLSALDAPQPPGRYLVVTEEDEIDGLSFQAFHRTATLLHLPAQGVASAIRQVVTVDPEELAAAHDADAGRP